MKNIFFKNKKIILITTFALFVLLVFYFTYLLRDDTGVSKTPYYTTKTEESSKNANDTNDQIPQEEVINEPDTSPKGGEEYTKSEFDYEDLKTMASDARALSQITRQFNESYPWYSKLPVENDSYVILWDLEKEQFRIVLKVSESVQREQKDSLIEKALIEIQNIAGWKPNQYEYYVVFLN